jgi:hypothetical protein
MIEYKDITPVPTPIVSGIPVFLMSIEYIFRLRDVNKELYNLPIIIEDETSHLDYFGAFIDKIPNDATRYDVACGE